MTRSLKNQGTMVFLEFLLKAPERKTGPGREAPRASTPVPERWGPRPGCSQASFSAPALLPLRQWRRAERGRPARLVVNHFPKGADTAEHLCPVSLLRALELVRGKSVPESFPSGVVGGVFLGGSCGGRGRAL
jgi:hypothetical protein